MKLKDWENKKYTAWRNKVNERLPNISCRVFELRKKFYSGCGFHYGLEALLGKVIHMINNYDMNCYHGIEGISNQIINRVLVEELFNKVQKIENENNAID